MLGVFGGTFDPIHLGHLRTGLEVRDALSMREVRFIPSRVPPHRKAPQAAAEQRLAMVAEALSGETSLQCDDRGMRRDGPSYTVDTLAALRGELNSESLGLIVGADAFEGIATWHQWARLVELAHLVVVHRPGWETRIPSAALDLLGDRVCTNRDEVALTPAGRVWFQPVTPLQISASAIRATVREGGSIRFLVPAVVERYIRDHRLYLDPEI